MYTYEYYMFRAISQRYKTMDKFLRYIRRDLKGIDGIEADTYLLQDRFPITVRFWYVTASGDDDIAHNYFLRLGPVTMTISEAAHSDLEEYFQRNGEEIIL